MSRSPSPVRLYVLLGAGTAAVLGSSVVVASMTTSRSARQAEWTGLVAPAEAQPAPAGAENVADGTQAVAGEAAEAGATTAPGAGSEAVPSGIASVEAPAPGREGGFGLGREALPEEVAAWDIDVRPDGQGLPVGSGDVWTGEEIFVAQCASCHGDFGEAVGRWPQLAGGFGTLASEDPVKTVGSFWPHLSTVVDYVHRAMPFGNAQSLSPDEVYALTAYILYLNDVVPDDFVLSDESFAEVGMPNSGGFYEDDRDATEVAPFSVEPCMEACKESVEITMRAAVLDVTPDAGEEAEEDAVAEATGAAATTEAASADAALAPEPATAEAPAGEEAAVEEAVPALAAGGGELDMALVEEGERTFRTCSACHQIGEGAVNRVGPVLNGVVGRTMGAHADFRYSKALLEAGEAGRSWTVEELSAFLADPRGHLPGNKMTFQGLRSDEEVAAVIEFLRSHPE